MIGTEFDINELETKSVVDVFEIAEPDLSTLSLETSEVEPSHVLASDAARVREMFFDQLKVFLESQNSAALDFIRKSASETIGLNPGGVVEMTERFAGSTSDAVDHFENEMTTIQADTQAGFEEQTQGLREKQIALISKLRKLGIMTEQIDLALQHLS